MNERIYFQFGEKKRITLPFSEVCMHMKVADKEMIVELLRPRRGPPMAQLYTLEGARFSFPITTGEAGILKDECGYFAVNRHPALELVHC